MPLYVMVGFDHPDSIARRETFRAEHRAYVIANMERIRLGGSFNDPNSKQIGTLLVFEADNEQAVWDWINVEPFYREGIFSQVEVRLWNLVIGKIAPQEPVT
jgi:uncharacterized protein